MLTSLQEKVASLFFSLPESAGFALAGGGALVVRGDVSRTTHDLDFFSSQPEDVPSAAQALREALSRVGLAFETVRSAASFVRLVVTQPDGEQVLVDISRDFRLREPDSSRLGPVLSADDLAADKTLALFGRAEARDFVDVFFLARKLGVDRLLELAKEKDSGFDLYYLAGMLGQLERHRREEFAVDDETFSQLVAFVHVLRADLLTRVIEGAGPGLSTGPTTGAR